MVVRVVAPNPMYRDMLIGEGKIHAYTNRPQNARSETGEGFLAEIGEFSAIASPPGAALPDGL